ncbi:MAG: hypothetical protein V4654_11710 [Bdellovibrionota bacterium]
MKTSIRVSVLISALIFTGSCAMIQKLTCNANNAKSSGARDATNGSINMPGLKSGDSCEGEYTGSQFQADYRQGFEEKKNQICQMGEVTKMAQTGVDAGLSKADVEKKMGACVTMSSYASLKNNMERTYMNGFCSTTRAEKIGNKHGSDMAEKSFEQNFAGCEAKWSSLKSAYEQAYSKASMQAHKTKQDLFVKNTGTSTFVLEQKNLSASCLIPADQSMVKVTVNNPNPSQTLVQGQWNYQYFDKDFTKIADDSGVDAVLLSPQSNKSFTKMTLPRNASFCRAEFAGIAQGANIK